MGGGSLDGDDSLIGFGGFLVLVLNMAACGESIHVIGFAFFLFALLRGCRGSIGILDKGRFGVRRTRQANSLSIQYAVRREYYDKGQGDKNI